MLDRTKQYTTWYLYASGLLGGIAWAVWIGLMAYQDPVIENKGQDYLYKQQQAMEREINTIRKLIKEAEKER